MHQTNLMLFINEIDGSDWFVLSLGAVVYLVLLYFELSRKDKTTTLKLLRSFLLFIAVASLVLIFLRPTYSVELPKKQLIVVTEPEAKEQLDSLKSKLSGADVYNLYNPSEENWIPDLTYLLNELGRGSSVYILGSSVHEKEISALPGVEITHLPTKQKNGILNVEFAENVRQGEKLDVSVIIHYSGIENGSIKLMQNGLVLDSLKLKTGQQSVNLKTYPKFSGQQFYELLLTGLERDTLDYVTLPVVVEEPIKLKIGIFSNYPSVELRELKNYLSEQGHQVLVRSQIALNNYTFEYLNTPTVNLRQLSSALLNELDLLITDEELVKDISTVERRNLKEAVENGLGWLVLTQNEEGNIKNLIFPSVNFRKRKTSGSRLILLPEQVILQSENNLVTNETTNGVPLGKVGGYPSVFYVYQELGKVGYTLISQTFFWVFNGKKKHYTTFWNHVISHMGRVRTEETVVELDYPAHQNAVVSFTLLTSEPIREFRLISPSGKAFFAPLRQNPYIKEKWGGEFYPKETGWYAFLVNNDTSYFYVVNNTNDKIILFQNQNKLQNVILNNRKRETFLNTINVSYYEKEIPLWYFFSVFLIMFSSVWVEEKLFK